jgi:hypothetical protein
VKHLFGSKVETIEELGSSEVNIGGRPFTISILASGANWDQKSKVEIKEAISRISFEFAERIDRHQGYFSGRAPNSDQINQRNATRQTLGSAPESGQQLLHR